MNKLCTPSFERLTRGLYKLFAADAREFVAA
jgi:hypothetical protein